MRYSPFLLEAGLQSVGLRSKLRCSLLTSDKSVGLSPLRKFGCGNKGINMRIKGLVM
jgi:hypothetical protein